MYDTSIFILTHFIILSPSLSLYLSYVCESTRIDESETDKNDRLKKWEKFLEVEEDSKKGKTIDTEPMEMESTSSFSATTSNQQTAEARPLEPQLESNEDEEKPTETNTDC